MEHPVKNEDPVIASNWQQTRLLASYIPKLVLKQYLTTPAKKPFPQIDVIQGACIFADISGFTPLTEKMSKLGRSGIERMTSYLNKFFDKLIGIIHFYGGDIVKFAGDAVLAIWPTDIVGTKLARLVNLASQCALKTHEILHNFDCDGVLLTLHIGVGSGKLGLVHVGGELSKAEFLITGDPLRQVALCESYAKSGEVYISKEAGELIQNDAKFVNNKGKKTKFARMDRDSICFMLTEIIKPEIPIPSDEIPNFSLAAEEFQRELTESVKQYVSPAITYKLSDVSKTIGEYDFCEMRNITVLFINLDFTYVRGAKELFQLQRAVICMQKGLYQYDGVVRQFLVDDKGSVLIGVFGTPPNAHENDPARAVLAAMSIQKSLKESVAINSRIGITTGPAFVGDVGNKDRREYAMVGDIVNLSARLMGKCQYGSILCDHATYVGVGTNSRIDFIALDPISVKGKVQPIQVYTPVHNIQTIVSPFLRRKEMEIFGREDEIAALFDVFEKYRASPNGTSIVILQGEAGFGKTLLLNQVLSNIVDETTMIFEGFAEEVEATTSYFIWREILSKIFELYKFNSSSPSFAKQIRENIKFWCESHHHSMTEDDQEMLSQFLDKSGGQHSMLVLRIKQIIIEVFRAIIDANASRFLILVLENIQWIDPASLEILYNLCENKMKMLVVIVKRPLAVTGNQTLIQLELSKMTENLNCFSLTLATMGVAPLTQIIQRRLKVSLANWPPIVDELLKERLGLYPNPLFALETADQLKSQGFVLLDQATNENVINIALLQQGGSLGSDADSIPSSLRGIYTAKIDRLSQTHQIVLKYASIIGRVFHVSLLNEILPIQPLDLLQSESDALTHAKLTREASQLGTSRKKKHSKQGMNVGDSTTASGNDASSSTGSTRQLIVHNATMNNTTADSPSILDATAANVAAIPTDANVVDPSENTNNNANANADGENATLNVENPTSNPTNNPSPTAHSFVSAVPKLRPNNVMIASAEPIGTTSSPSTPTSANLVAHKNAANSGWVTANNANNTNASNSAVAEQQAGSEASGGGVSPHFAPKKMRAVSIGEKDSLLLKQHTRANSANSSGQLTANLIVRDEKRQKFHASSPEPASTPLIPRSQSHQILSSTPRHGLGSARGEKSSGGGSGEKASEGSERKESPTKPVSFHPSPSLFLEPGGTHAGSASGDGQFTVTLALSVEIPGADSPSVTSKDATTSTSHQPSPQSSTGTPSGNSKRMSGKHGHEGTAINSKRLSERRPAKRHTDGHHRQKSGDRNSGSDFQQIHHHHHHNQHPNLGAPQSPTVTPQAPVSDSGLTSSKPFRVDAGSIDLTGMLSFQDSTTVTEIDQTEISNVSSTGDRGSLSQHSTNTEKKLKHRSGNLLLHAKSREISSISNGSASSSSLLGGHKISHDLPSHLCTGETPARKARLDKANQSTQVQRRGSEKPHFRSNSLELELDGNEPVVKLSLNQLDITHEKENIEALRSILNQSQLKDTVEPLELRPNFYKFKQAIVNEVLTETILPSKLVTVHRKIAEILENNPKYAPESVTEELANHWRKADQPVEAIEYCSTLAEAMLDQYNHRRATELLLTIISLEKQLIEPHNKDLIIKWQRQLAEAFYNLGEFENSVAQINFLDTKILENLANCALVFPDFKVTSDQIFLKSGPKVTKAASTKKSIFRSMNTREKKEAVLPWETNAYVNINSETVRALLCLAQGYFYSSKSLMLTRCVITALTIAEKIGTGTSEFCRSLSYGILASAISGQGQKSNEYIALGRSIYKDQWPRRSVQLEALSYSGAGQFSLSEELLERTLRISEEEGDFRSMEECSIYLSFNFYFQAKFNESQEKANLAWRSSCIRGDLQMQVLSLLAQALIAFSTGNPKQLTKIVSQIESYTKNESLNYQMDAISQMLYHAVKALFYFENNEFLKAFDETVSFEKIFKNKDIKPTVYFSFLAAFYVIIVRVALRNDPVFWKHITNTISKKKFASGISDCVVILEDFKTRFKLALPAFLICDVIKDKDHASGKSTLNEALYAATNLCLPVFVTMIHFILSSPPYSQLDHKKAVEEMLILTPELKDQALFFGKVLKERSK